jgi:malate synthase
VLYDFITSEALPGTGVDPDSFWDGVGKVVTDLAPQNADLLTRRDELQAQIDKWHRQRVIEPHDAAAYKAFLTEIGYLLPEPDHHNHVGGRPRDHHDRRTAAGGARAQRPFRP